MCLQGRVLRYSFQVLLCTWIIDLLLGWGTIVIIIFLFCCFCQGFLISIVSNDKKKERRAFWNVSPLFYTNAEKKNEKTNVGKRDQSSDELKWISFDFGAEKGLNKEEPHHFLWININKKSLFFFFCWVSLPFFFNNDFRSPFWNEAKFNNQKKKKKKRKSQINAIGLKRKKRKPLIITLNTKRKNTKFRPIGFAHGQRRRAGRKETIF